MMPLKFKPATFPDEGPPKPLGKRTVASGRGRRDPKEIKCENK